MFAQISIGNSSETLSKELIISDPKGINCEFENGFKRKIEDSMLDSTIKGTLIGDNKLTKSEMDKKRVSFNVFNVKR